MNNIIVKVEIIDQDKKVKILETIFTLGKHYQGFDVPILIEGKYLFRGWGFEPKVEVLEQ